MNPLVMVWVCLGLLTGMAWRPAAGMEPERVVFFALGDQGSGNEDQRRVARAMEQVATRNNGVDFVVLLGDNFYMEGVSSIHDPQWQDTFETIYTGPILDKTPFYPIIGNHDARGDVEAEVEYGRKRLGSGRWRMQARNDFLDRGRGPANQPLLRLVLLDATGPMAQQNRFVQERFACEPNCPVWRMVASHYPLRSSGAHGDSDTLLREFLPTLRAARVHLHLSGHDHSLEVLRPPDEPLYVVSGGGGFRLYPLKTLRPWSAFAAKRHGFLQVVATATALELTLFDDQGEKLYQTGLSSSPPATPGVQ